jgi:hypothetical protein
MPLRPNTPVWAPDPAVPLIARILAYLFAVLILLTVIRACAIPRPLDYPVYPTNWKQENNNGILLQYPDNWQQINLTDPDPLVVTDLQFIYSPPTSGMQQIRVITVSDLNTDPETIVSSLINHYTLQPGQGEDQSADWHTFSGTTRDTNKPFLGAWTSRIIANQLVLLLAYAPTPGWEVTQQVLSYMSAHVQAADDDEDDIK